MRLLYRVMKTLCRDILIYRGSTSFLLTHLLKSIRNSQGESVWLKQNEVNLTEEAEKVQGLSSQQP